MWLILSLSYLYYLHGACVVFILLISLINYSIVKLFANYKYCISLIWSFNLSVLILNRVYEGYSFSSFRENLAFLDNYRGTFRWHICFNFASPIISSCIRRDPIITQLYFCVTDD